MAEIVKNSIKSEYIVNGLGPNKVNVLIGGKDEVVENKFVPNINFSFECFSEDVLQQEYFYINLNRKDVIITSQKETFLNNKIEINLGKEVHIYRIDEKILKWDIRFDSRPLVNSWDWDLQFSKGLMFTRQNTLEEDYYTIGGEGAKSLSEFLNMAHRPDEVIGSYTVYCTQRNWTRDWKGRTRHNFKSGKLGHIYVPYFIDSIGRKKRSILFIDPENHLLQISCDPAWLDTAVYPVILDPDFGHDTSDFGDTAITLDNQQRGVIGTTGGAGTGDNCYLVAGAYENAGDRTKMHLYTPAADGTKITNGDTVELSGPQSTGVWLAHAFNTPPSLEAATTYLVIGWGKISTITIMYDSSNNVNRFYDAMGYTDWPDPLAGTYGSSSFNYCTYCSYTETGGISIPVVMQQMDHFNGGMLNG